jgi:hypothetical protein
MTPAMPSRPWQIRTPSTAVGMAGKVLSTWE